MAEDDLLRNLKLTIEYQGTRFAGWQRQPEPHVTIQKLLEDAIAKMTGAFSLVRGAGRTDAGVHARGQVANFRTESRILEIGFLRGLNTALPRDIAVARVEEVDDTFDARYSARGKHYSYRIFTREARSPFFERLAWRIPRSIDVAAMRMGALALVGEHDFSAFRAADCDRINPVRVMRRLEVRDTEPFQIVIDLEATAFLKHMVRVIVGTLAEVGLGKRSPQDINQILAGKDRRLAGRTAPPHGLTLEQVFYDSRHGSS